MKEKLLFLKPGNDLEDGKQVRNVKVFMSLIFDLTFCFLHGKGCLQEVKTLTVLKYTVCVVSFGGNNEVSLFQNK